MILLWLCSTTVCLLASSRCGSLLFGKSRKLIKPAGSRHWACPSPTPGKISSNCDIEFLEIKPRAGARVRKRGQRGGIQARNCRCGYKPVLPSVIMGNVRSLINETDKLTACLKSDRLYQLSSLLSFSETWISDKIGWIFTS